MSRSDRKLAIVTIEGRRTGDPRKGGFAAVHHLVLPAGGAQGMQTMRLAAADLAEKAGADWLILLQPGETLAQDALELMTPGLDIFDAIFGAAHVEGSGEIVSRLTRLDFDSADRLPHALLNWWMPESFLVRTSTARETLARIASNPGTHKNLDYLFDLWRHARCLKSAQPLLVLERPPEPLDQSDRQDVLRRLKERTVFLPVVHGDTTYHLPYTGQNAGIEREQSRGLFFEAGELEELRKVVKPGARIVDVGANTGNHTVFFAGPMQAALVTPFEPMPDAASALRASVARNGLANVDLSQLGIGIADSPGRARLATSVRGGLGATNLESDPSGDIVVAPLDSVISGPVDFLKIDVEGMEMAVLAGARAIIERSKPLIFIEIANGNTLAFSDWLDKAAYEVKRIFTDKGHANYLIAARGRA